MPASLYVDPRSDISRHYGDGTHPAFGPNLYITNVRLPFDDPAKMHQFWDVVCSLGRVRDVVPHVPGRYTYCALDGKGGLLMPSLCHPHIHLDKCFILDKCDPLVTGSFEEAMELTAKVKATFSTHPAEFIERARRVIAESVQCGVTSMRAHVETDAIVGLAGIHVARKLAKEWFHACDVQVAAFMQEPLFASRIDTTPGPNFRFLQEAATKQGVYAIGSAPYVEPTLELAKRNIDLVLKLAEETARHVDFHLDYNINPASEPLIFYVLSRVRATHWGGPAQTWPEELLEPQRHITIGHCTRLCVFTPAQWQALREAAEGLPVTIVGLPQSDLYMIGRPLSPSTFNSISGMEEGDGRTAGPPRATLRVPQIARDYGLEIAMGVNNVFNPFTPQGELDPLSLTSLGAGIFQTATPQDLAVLLRSVTLTAKRALGTYPRSYLDRDSLVATENDPADFVLLPGARSLASAALHPGYERYTVRAGRVVAERKVRGWNDVDNPRALEGAGGAGSEGPAWIFMVRWRYVYCPPLYVYDRWTGQVIPQKKWKPRQPPRFYRPGPSKFDEPDGYREVESRLQRL